MSYINSENKIIKLIDNLPKEMVKSGDYDIVYLIVKISEPYDLSYDEIEKIYDEIFEILTGKKEATFLEKKIKEIVSPDNQQNTHKIASEIEDKVINPIKKALGINFPIKITVPQDESQKQNLNISSVSPSPKTTETQERGNKEENLNRDSILKEIENPKSLYTYPVPPRKEPFPHQVEIRPETLPANMTAAPKPAESENIAEKKMNAATSIPKVEKNYGSDPYREPLK